MNLDYIDLNDAQVIAQGSSRNIFQHPQNDRILIKTVRWDGSDAARALKKNRPSLRNYGAYASWHREVSEYLRIINRIGRLPEFIAPFFGFCQTSEGVGLLVGKVCDLSGNLARNAAELAAGVDSLPSMHARIERLLVKMGKSSAIATDLRLRNLALDENSNELVVIDGLGDRVLIPIKAYSDLAYSRWLNRKRVLLFAEAENLSAKG